MSIFDSIRDYFTKKDIEEIENRSSDIEPGAVGPKEPEQITAAKKYHGLREVEDRAELRKLLNIDPATTAWCAAFVNAIEKQCGRKGTDKLNARSYLKYGSSVSTPEGGDIVVFKRGTSDWEGHVGYYIADSADGKSVLVLGGNQGNKVCYKYYSKKDLLGYRRP